jgi:hypothetical protein
VSTSNSLLRVRLRGQDVQGKVDVLVIGSGAAVAWSLAETQMRILCLELATG